MSVLGRVGMALTRRWERKGFESDEGVTARMLCWAIDRVDASGMLEI